MEREELMKVLDLHEKWVREESGGVCANLQGADLRGVSLRGIDLRRASLQGVNLRGADLRGASLQGTELQGAALWRADLQGADLDFSTWPLWCGSLIAYIDDRIAIQLLYHLLCPVQASPYVSQEVKERLLTDDLIDLANCFHRVEECGEIER